MDSRCNSRYTPLHIAADRGHVEVIRFLASEGADVSSINNIGTTPLEGAICFKHIDAVRVLVDECGVGVNSKNRQGETALHRAALMGQVEIVKFLIDRGADLTIKCNEGRTPLDVAERKGNSEIIRLCDPQSSGL